MTTALSNDISIDLTILKPEAISREVFEYCDFIVQNRNKSIYHSICVNPKYVKIVKEKYPQIRITSVIDFPLGASNQKIQQIESALKDGASEVDVVMDMGAFCEGNYQKMAEDMKEMANLVHRHNGIIKIIMETCMWDQVQLKKIVELCNTAGVDFIKTSTGFHQQDLKEHMLVRAQKLFNTVKFLAAEIKAHNYHLKIKASGGIKTLSQIKKLTELGANRVGTSCLDLEN